MDSTSPFLRFRKYLSPGVYAESRISFKLRVDGLLAWSWRPRCVPSGCDQENLISSVSCSSSNCCTILAICIKQLSSWKLPSSMMGCSTMCSGCCAPQLCQQLYFDVRSTTLHSLTCFIEQIILLCRLLVVLPNLNHLLQ